MPSPSPINVELGLYDSQAELNILAAAFNTPTILGDIAERLGDRASDDPIRSIAFMAIRRLASRSQPVTPASVAAEMRMVAVEHRISDTRLFTAEELTRQVKNVDLSGVNLVATIERLRDLEQRRSMTSIVEETIRLFSLNLPPEELRRQLGAAYMRTIGDIADNRIVYGYDTVGLIDNYIDYQVRKRANGEIIIIPRWPFASMNAIVTPLIPGTVAFLGGSDGSSKTSIAETIAEWWAREYGLFTLYAHTEYTFDFMGMRRLSRYTGIPVGRLMFGMNQQSYLTPGELERIRLAQKFFAQKLGTLDYLYAGGLTAKQLISHLHVRKEAKRLQMLVVDYFHDLAPVVENRGGNEYWAMGEGMRLLHEAARHLEIPVLIVVRGKKEMLTAETPDKSMIEGGAGLVYKSQNTNVITRFINKYPGQGVSAKLVNGVWRIIPDYGEVGQLTQLIRVHVLKQTMGRTGVFHLWQAGPYYIIDVPDVVAEKLDLPLAYADPFAEPQEEETPVPVMR